MVNVFERLLAWFRGPKEEEKHVPCEEPEEQVAEPEEPAYAFARARAVIKVKLEPYLGFLHSVQFGKPSLVCDLQEPYRYLVDDFVIQYCQVLRKKDFIVKAEDVSRKRKGKREYLNDAETKRMMKQLHEYFESKVDIPLIRHDKRQRIETLINEETLLLAKFLRDELKTWIHRMPSALAN